MADYTVIQRSWSPMSSRREPNPGCCRSGEAMTTDGSSESELNRKCLREVLLGYMVSAGCPSWPGSDGQTVEEVLHSYPQAASSGRVPNRAKLLREHPGLAEHLTAFFSEHGNS